ncbi:hypothetical protein KCV07_g4977, partial [Aureobasidium melanogenum]
MWRAAKFRKTFNLRFDKKTRLMGLPEAVLYMSCDDLEDMVVYVLIRKLDENGKAMIAINIPWKRCPYPDTASIPESDYSNLGDLLRTHYSAARFSPQDRPYKCDPQYPFNIHDELQKITPDTDVVPTC